MSRTSIFVTVSAVVALLGSLACLALSTFEFALPFIQPDLTKRAGGMKAVFFLSGAWILAWALWGLATAIGLFRKARWARISMLVFGVLLFLFGALLAVVMGVLPLPAPPPQPDSTAVNAMQVVRVVFVTFYGLLALLGAGWAWGFNTRAVKTYFAEGPTTENASGRPVSITVIAWWMLLGAALMPMMLLLRLPAAFFGLVLTGWSAALLYVGFAAVQVYVGLGLLRLQPNSWRLATGWLTFGALNGISYMLIPGAVQRSYAAMPSWMPQTQTGVDFPFPPSLFVAITAVFMAIPIWFLISRRHAFREQSSPPIYN